MTKLFRIIVILIILFLLVWILGNKKDNSVQLNQEGGEKVEMVVGSEVSANAVSSRDSSDKSLEKDIASIEAELQVIDRDFAEINKGLNDNEKIQ
jgi:competence protein ComGC